MQPSVFLVKVPITLLQREANIAWRTPEKWVEKPSMSLSLFSLFALTGHYFSSFFISCFPAINENWRGEVTRNEA